METGIHGRSILIVGASAGIGRDTALSFARAGARVMAVGRRHENLEALAAEANLEWCASDFTLAGEAERIVSAAVEAFGGIDLLLNVAAVSPIALLSDVSTEVLQQIFLSNVIAPSQVCQAALPHLNENGMVGFLSSETVGRPRRGLVPYGASKAALEELVNGWRVENPLHRFVTVRVGATIGTDFGRDFGGDLIAECFDDWIKGGHLSANYMTSDVVGNELAELLAVALLHPTVELTDLSLRPPGPLATLS